MANPTRGPSVGSGPERFSKKRPNSARTIRDLQKHPDPYVTTSDLAGSWKVSRKQIYKQIDAGTLKAIRLGPRLLRISTAEAIRFEDNAKMSPVPEGQVAPHGGSGKEKSMADKRDSMSTASSRSHPAKKLWSSRISPGTTE